MDFFDRIKRVTEWIPFKDSLRSLYGPLLERLKFKQQNKKFKKSGYDVLNRAGEVLDSLGITFWLEFGTLLGVVRDKQLIKHDLDIDLGLFMEDYSDQVANQFIEKGFKLKHEIIIEDGTGREQSFIYDDITVDLFYFSKKGEIMFCHLFPLSKGNERLVREVTTHNSGVKAIEFNGRSFNIPKDEEQRLVDTYGEEWTIPIQNWYTPDDALNSELINKKAKYIVSAIH